MNDRIVALGGDPYTADNEPDTGSNDDGQLDSSGMDVGSQLMSPML
jgi:hypothetical protein